MSPYQEKLAAAKAERQRHIDAWRVSGLTQAAYAAAQGIHATTFNGWLRAAQRALDAMAGVAGAAGDQEAPAAAETATATINTAPVLTIRPVLVQSAAHSPVSALPSPPSPPSPPSAPSASAPSPSMASMPVAPMSPSINASVPESRITLHGLGGWHLKLTDSVDTAWLASLLRELDAAPTAPTAPTAPKRAGTC